MKRLIQANQEKLTLMDLKDFQQIVLVSEVFIIFKCDYHQKLIFPFQSRWKTILKITQFLPVFYRCLISPNITAIKILSVENCVIFWLKFQSVFGIDEIYFLVTNSWLTGEDKYTGILFMISQMLLINAIKVKRVVYPI